MPRKMKDREDMSSKFPSRMESVPGAIEAPKKRERRSRHPDIEQMMQDMQIEEQEEQAEKVEALRENIDTSEVDTLSKELRDFQNQARDIQASLESDGIGPDMYALDDEMEFDRRLRGMSRKNATGLKKFWNGLGSMLTGGPADPEFYDEIIERYLKLHEVEAAAERRKVRLDEISAPERNKKRGRVPRGISSGASTYVSGIRGGAASIDGGGDLNLAKSFKESYQARGGAKKVKKALEEIKPETEHLEDTQAVIEQRETERAIGRVAAQDFEGTAADFEKSFGLDEEPKDESIDIDVSEFNEPAKEKEKLSRQETQAILRLDMMAKGLSDLRADISKVGNDESAALEQQADFQDRMKEYEKGIEALIQSNLDSTSDELYENVVAAQESLSDAKTAFNTVYSIIAEDARKAGKGKRVMGMVRSGGRSSGAKTYGTSAMDRAGSMRPAQVSPEVSEEAWQKKVADDQAVYDAEAQKRETENEAIPLVTKKTRDRKREYAKQIKAAEVVEAERDGIKVEQVSEIKDPFAERQGYYASNAELMKWAIESKNFNAAELWEKANSAIESLDNYDRSELSTILKNAPDLAAAYVLEVAKVKRGDESARGHVIRANLVLNLPPEANIERSSSVVLDKAYEEDIKKAKKTKKKAA